MKKIGIIALLILAILVVLPYITGKVAETATLEFAHQVNLNEEYGEVEVVNYDRGVRSTQSVFSWKPPVDAKSDFAGPIEYTCDGSHGIISYTYVCKAVDVPMYSEFVAEKLNGVDPIKVTGSVSLFGAVTNSIIMDEFEIKDSDNMHAKFSSGELNIVTDKDFKTFDSEISWKGLSITEETEVMNVGPIEIEGEFEQNDFGIFLGDYEVDIASFTSEKSGQIDFGVYDVASSGKLKEEGDNIVLVYDWRVDRINAKDPKKEQARTFKEASDLKFRSELSGINTEKFAELYKLLREVAELDSLSGDDADEQRNQKLIGLMPAFEALLLEGLAIELDFSSKFDGEPMKFELDLELADQMSLADAVLLTVQPQAFFDKLRVKLKSSIPEDMIEKSPSSSQAFLNSSLYEKDGDRYQLDFSIRENEVELNGKTMNAQEFMTQMAGRG